LTANSQGWSTEVEGGIWSAARTSSDTDIEGSPFFGGYFAGYSSGTVGNFNVAIDGRFELLDDQGADDVYVTGPLHTGVLGVHVGRETGAGYFGGYAAAGWFDGYDSESPMSGYITGIEMTRNLANGGALYGQAGYAVAIGDPGDNEFMGPAAKFGIMTELGNGMGLDLSFEYAKSPDCFEDCGSGQWGRYIALNVEVTYGLNNQMDLVGDYSLQQITANDEDYGTSNNVYVGIRVPLGDKAKTGLRTPMGAFNAAGWMAPLD